MDQRVRLLETDMAYIKGKLEDMPTKEWVIVKFIWAIGAITAITALIEYGPALILRLSQ